MFNKYPYTDFHDINLDWILHEIMKLHHEYDEFKAVNTITNAGAWDITKQYQAWTVVSDNNAGYISLKPVPVGIAISNIEYWGLIADYNILITDLSNRISVLEGQMSTLNNTTIPAINAAITTVDNKYDHLINKKYLFFGDSYNFNGGGWLTGVVNALGITEYYDYTVSGHGFTTSTDWGDDIQRFRTEHPDVDETITDIVIVGGINDAMDSSFSTLSSKVTDFCDYVALNFPLAKITMCYVGNAEATSSVLDTRTYANRLKCMNIEERVLTSYGHIFAPGCQNALFQYTLFNADGLHPNSYGQSMGIIPAVVSALTGSEFNPMYHQSTGSIQYNGVTEIINNGRNRLILSTLPIADSVTVGTSWVDVYTLANEISCNEHTPVYCSVEIRNPGSETMKHAYARIHDHKLQLCAADTLNTSTYDTFTTNNNTYVVYAVFDDDIQGSL